MRMAADLGQRGRRERLRDRGRRGRRGRRRPSHSVGQKSILLACPAISKSLSTWPSSHTASCDSCDSCDSCRILNLYVWQDWWSTRPVGLMFGFVASSYIIIFHHGNSLIGDKQLQEDLEQKVCINHEQKVQLVEITREKEAENNTKLELENYLTIERVDTDSPLKIRK